MTSSAVTTKRAEKTEQTEQTKQLITIERILQATPEEVWEMWTTKDGIESWWGPEGFDASVLTLDLRAGGRLEIEVRATAPEVVKWMEAQGAPLASVHRATYTEITPITRIGFLDTFAYDPSVDPYELRATVEFEPVPAGTRMFLQSDPMHNEEWTKRATMGRESSFDRLAAALEKASSQRAVGAR
jgi:uncharacterized protein YndB with AHSA1/START domain